MSYPDLPNNRLIVNGVDLSIRFQMVLLDGYTLEPPEPKTYTVDIPGGNGVIDLTEALTGDVAYKNRKQEFTFAIIDVKNFEKVKTEVSNFLHGRAFDYTMTMDPGYTYHGRFSVDSYSHEAYANGLLGQFKIKVDANPYKLKEHCAYRLNGVGGGVFRLESGRRPVHPTIECETPTIVAFDGKEQTVPAGTYRMNDVVFNDGYNEIYVNNKLLEYVRWSELEEHGAYQSSWEDLSKTRWNDIQKLAAPNTEAPRCWNDLFETRWSDLSEKTWNSLNFSIGNEEQKTIYLTYNWEDL